MPKIIFINLPVLDMENGLDDRLHSSLARAYQAA